MTSFIEQFSRIRRPGILIRAALHYLEGKSRVGKSEPHGKQPPRVRSDAQLHRLIDDEHHHNQVRRTSSAEYNLKAHIEVLAELIATAQALRKRSLSAV